MTKDARWMIALAALSIGLATALGAFGAYGLYALTFGAPKVIGIVTPLGGLSLMTGWVLFALTIWSAR